jgi:ubiquinone/menaquinone biosynthesis C-methylase UbiE
MDPEIRAYYESGIERDRLAAGYSRIEYERTKDLLGRRLPPPPARVLDVGGGPGAYAEWLAHAGYERDDRLQALREARRALRRGGVVAAAAISRFASVLDGLYAGYLSDPRFWPTVVGASSHLVAVGRVP